MSQQLWDRSISPNACLSAMPPTAVCSYFFFVLSASVRQALLETLEKALRSDAIMRAVSGRCAPRKTSKLRPVLSSALAVATLVGHDCPIVFRGEHRHSTFDATRLTSALGLALHCTTTPDGYSVAVHGENLHMLLRALARVEQWRPMRHLGNRTPKCCFRACRTLCKPPVRVILRWLRVSQSSQWLETTNQERSSSSWVKPCMQRGRERRGRHIPERLAPVT